MNHPNQIPANRLPPIKPRMSLPARLASMTLFFGSAAFFALQGDVVLASVLAVIGIGCFAGYRTGAAYMIGSLVAIGVAIAFAPSLGVSQEFRFHRWFGTTGLTNRALSIGTIGVLISFAVTMVWFTLAGLFLANRPRMETMNRWLGFVTGGVQAAVASLLFLGGLLILEPIEAKRADTRDPLDLRGQFVSKWILGIADGVHQSRIGPLVVAYNPFERLPQLNKIREIQQGVQVLADGQRIDDLIHHPDIEKLKRRPEMKEAIEQLIADPEISDMLRSGQPLDGDAAMTLLNHPAVLELIDQPGFVEEAYRVIRESKLSP